MVKGVGFGRAVGMMGADVLDLKRKPLPRFADKREDVIPTNLAIQTFGVIQRQRLSLSYKLRSYYGRARSRFLYL